MKAHDLLIRLVRARERLNQAKAKTLRMHGRRQSDRVTQSMMNAELRKANHALVVAEYELTIYAQMHFEDDRTNKNVGAKR